MPNIVASDIEGSPKEINKLNNLSVPPSSTSVLTTPSTSSNPSPIPIPPKNTDNSHYMPMSLDHPAGKAQKENNLDSPNSSPTSSISDNNI